MAEYPHRRQPQSDLAHPGPFSLTCLSESGPMRMADSLGEVGVGGEQKAGDGGRSQYRPIQAGVIDR